MSELEEFYKVFDNAVRMMPSELRAKADVRRTRTEFDGAIVFLDQHNRAFAKVDIDGDVSYPSEAPPPAPAKKATPAARPGMTRKEQEILIAVAKKVNDLDELTARFMQMVTKKIEKLDATAVTKGIDAEVIDELGGVFERIEALETTAQFLRKEVADKRMVFRGFWRHGKEANKNELFTHNGSCWIAIRDTDEAPSESSPDWTLIARKGRDAKKDG